MEKFEIFETFMKRYNVDMGMLHEEADGPWLPQGEVHNDWVGDGFKIYSSMSSHGIFYFREMLVGNKLSG